MSPKADPVRIALVGARRVRQGLGPFVARHLTGAGAQVVGFVGTSPASRQQASEQLQSIARVRVPGYANLPELVDACGPQAVAILCPPEAHGDYLDQALELGLHALCEKPLSWSADGEREAQRAADWVQGFRQQGLLLMENCQWPEVLEGVRALEPDLLANGPSRFGMGLEPASSGDQMVGDALSHPLSLLQSLAPGPAQVSEIKARWGASGQSLDLSFRFAAGSRAIQARVELTRTDRAPRGAWIELEGQRFERLVRPSDYAMFLACGPRVQDLQDPLERLLQRFVRELEAVLRGASPPDPSPIAERARLLHQLRQACGAPI